MTKLFMALLIAAFAGLCQAVAEHVTKVTIKQVDVSAFLPGLEPSPREMLCRVYPDKISRCCASGREPRIEWTPDQKNWKAVCHRAVQ
jgi:hypothetical protein